MGAAAKRTKDSKMTLDPKYSGVTRRAFLGGVAALGVAGSAALAGCSSGNAGTGGGNGKAPDQSKIASILPTYKVADFVKPDLASTPEGVPNAYFSYPKTQPDSVQGTPGAGGTITMLTLTWDPIAPTGAGNTWLANMNKRLGATLAINAVPAADFAAKVATATAGSDLPDVITMNGVSRMPQLLEAKFENLTEHLAGDKVLEYPNLANVTTSRWRNCIFNNAIYAIPAQNLVGSPTWFTNDKILNEVGVTWNPKNADEVAAFAKEIKAKAKDTYPLGSANNVLNNMATAMWNLPNGWGQTGGKFSHMWEDDKFRKALDWTSKLWAEGLMHPDSFAGFDTKANFIAGRTVVQCDGGTAWTAHVLQGMTISPAKIPSAEGTGASTRRLSNGMVAPIAISKQSSPDRVKEILRVLNWCSAPFGTSESRARLYGVEGEHFTFNDKGAPVQNEQGKAQREIALSYLASVPYDFFVPGHDEVVKRFHQDQLDTLPTGKASAANGLYSATADSKGATLNRALNDVINDIIQGRKKLADFDTALATWKSGGGDTIRGEYEESYASMQ